MYAVAVVSSTRCHGIALVCPAYVCVTMQCLLLCLSFVATEPVPLSINRIKESARTLAAHAGLEDVDG